MVACELDNRSRGIWHRVAAMVLNERDKSAAAIGVGAVVPGGRGSVEHGAGAALIQERRWSPGVPSGKSDIRTLRWPA
jgi:hypothetical protein